MQKSREILTNLGSNLQLLDKTLLPDKTNDFISMKKMSSEAKIIYKRLEPKRKTVTKV